MHPFTITVIAYTCLILTLIVVAVFTDKRHYITVKMLCSVSFLAIALWFTAQGANDPYRMRFAFTGLVLCALGDLFMGQYNRYRKKNYMASGILTFLLAHTAFLAYFYHISPKVHWFAILFPIVSCLALWCIIPVFRLHLGKLKGFTILYCAFVSSLMGKALTMGQPRLAIASTLFWISDFTLVFLYFYHYRNKKVEKITHAVNLSTYYSAMLLLAIPL